MVVLFKLFFIGFLTYWIYLNIKKLLAPKRLTKVKLLWNFIKFISVSIFVINYEILSPHHDVFSFFMLISGIIFFIVLILDLFNIELGKKVFSKRTTLLYSVIIILLMVGVIRYNNIIFDKYKTFAHGVIYPIQKSIAILITGREITMRKEKFISYDDLKVIQSDLKPGDILLKRNDWQLTNIPISGFWTHSGMYIGTLEELDKYFWDITKSYNKRFSDILKEKNYTVYNQLKKNSNLSIIEAIAPKVCLNPLDNMAKSDYFAALRPRVEKEEKMKAILKSFVYLDCPYDYDFDFNSDDAFICTELIKKSYGNNIHFTLRNKNGQEIITPNDIVGKYIKEYQEENRELDFVLFYDGKYETKEALRCSAEELKESFTRKKIYSLKKTIPDIYVLLSKTKNIIIQGYFKGTIPDITRIKLKPQR